MEFELSCKNVFLQLIFDLQSCFYGQAKENLKLDKLWKQG